MVMDDFYFLEGLNIYCEKAQTTLIIIIYFCFAFQTKIINEQYFILAWNNARWLKIKYTLLYNIVNELNFERNFVYI